MRLLVIGLIAGFFSALFGVGGGIVMVPLLLLVAHYSERPAMATSLTAVGLIALVGSVSYALHGEVKPGAAAVAGHSGRGRAAVVGASLQQRLANRTLSFAFAALLGRRRRLAPDLMWALLLAGALGLVAGVLAGLFGIGGGTLFVPTLALVLGLTQLHAEATSLLAILPTAVAGAWRQRRYGNVRRGGPRCSSALLRSRGSRRACRLPSCFPSTRFVRLFALLMFGVAAQDRDTRLAQTRLSFLRWRHTKEIWLPLVDEPIGSIVGEIQRENRRSRRWWTPRASCSPSARSPTFGSGSCSARHAGRARREARRRLDHLGRTAAEGPAAPGQVAREVRAVAKEIAADPAYANDAPVGPDDARAGSVHRVREAPPRRRF